MTKRPVDIAFTPSVKAAQERKDSRKIYERMEMGRTIDENLATFIGRVRSFYLATASAEGQPYIQHRGGPPGFLHVVGEHSLAFADFKGNRQFISTGNLAENPRAFIFLMDYAHRQRIKIWGSARVVEGDAELEKRLMPTPAFAHAGVGEAFGIVVEREIYRFATPLLLDFDRVNSLRDQHRQSLGFVTSRCRCPGRTMVANRVAPRFCLTATHAKLQDVSN